MPETKKEQVLSVRDLDITFKTTAGPVHAIRGVNIDLYKGETVALPNGLRAFKTGSPPPGTQHQKARSAGTSPQRLQREHSEC